MKNHTECMWFKFGFVVLVLLAGNLSFFAGSEIFLGDEVRNLYILSIGIDKYEAGGMTNLKLAKNDANALSEEFEKRGKYKFAEVKKVVLLDGNAEKENILNELDRLSREISSNDVFIFTFSGLGSHFPGLNNKGEFFLIPSDGSWKTVYEKGISNNELQSYFRKIRAKRKLVVLDSCDSASGFETAMNTFIETDENIVDLVKDEILFIGTDTISYEEMDLGLGTLSAIVLDAIKGAADFDKDGEVSFREIEAYAYIGGITHSARYKKDFHPRTIIRGNDFKVSATDKKIREVALEKAKKEKETQQAENKTGSKGKTRAETFVTEENMPKKSARKGKDYAVLFANQNYDNAGWNGLKNPFNDVNDIKKELEERYGFQVIVKKDLTTKEIYDTIKQYQSTSEEKYDLKEDQILFFFAGHGIADEANRGYFVGRDSPSPFKLENSGNFVSLEVLLTYFERIPVEHMMVVFDACFAGKLWKAPVQRIQDYGFNPQKKGSNLAKFYDFFETGLNSGPSTNSISMFVENYQDGYSKLVYAKDKMNNRTRLSMTSGDRPVLDSWEKADGSLSDNSPFADAFLRVLRNDGGDDEVVIVPEFIPVIDKLDPKPQTGRISSNSDGDFVFVRKDKAKESQR